ncbi:MAG: DUF4286 family protein, partial [Bacteroidota bacterium]
YNVTVKIEHGVHDEWLQWMKTTHIPDVMNTGKFLESKICKMIGTDEADGLTYSFQYIAPDMKTFMEYQNEFAKALQKDHSDRYQGKYVAFRSLMEIEAEFS